ncbi:hypothetical protein OIV83_000383 [Microbotryomycetes sp. JL201]|nr:hypothetical protein OIV83_000383 [Microbotryomycetes sp. JL201]
MAQDLVLDPAIRDWVLLPLTAIMLLSGLIRHYVAVMIQSPPKRHSLKAIREQRALARGALLRNNASHVDPSSFAALKQHLQHAYTTGSYLQEPPKDKTTDEQSSTAPPNPLADPKAMDGMMDMFKKQAVGFLPQTLLMYYISYFFDGFVLTRLPFPLTVRFKAMLQRGIDTTDMDASWVSSVSWYFLCLFGLTPIYKLLLGQDNGTSFHLSICHFYIQTFAKRSLTGSLDGVGHVFSLSSKTAADDSLNPMQSIPGQPAPQQQQQPLQSPLHSFNWSNQPQPPQMPGQPVPDFQKLFKQENENLQLVRYDWVANDVESRILNLF